MFVSIIGRNSVCRDLTSFLLAAFVIALSVFSRASAVANTDTVNTEAVFRKFIASMALISSFDGR